MSQTTRCPRCATLFRVVADQLRISDGWVRCGQCKEVFDATEHLQQREPEPLLPDMPLDALAAPRRAPQRAGAAPAPQAWGGVSPSDATPSPSDAPTAPGAAAPAPAQPPATAPAPLATPTPAPAHVPSFLLARAPQDAPALLEEAPAGAALPPAALAAPEPAEPVPVPGADDPSPRVPMPEPVVAQAPAAPVTEAGTAPEEAPALGLGPDFREAPGLPVPSGPVEEGRQLPGHGPEEPEPEPQPEPEREREPDPEPGSEAGPATQAPPPPAQAAPDAGDFQDSVFEPGTEPEFVRAARRGAFWRKPAVRGVLTLLVLALGALLAVQAGVRHRDALVARQPALRVVLEPLCERLGCVLSAPRELSAVVIDSSSFLRSRADPAGYELRFGLKNNAAYPVAMPMVELTLTDARDEPVVRRVVDPQPELGAPAQLAPGAVWNASAAVQVLDAGASVAGYRLLAFYP